MSRRQLALKASVVDGSTAILRNQTAWFMREIIKHGKSGFTKAQYPGLHVGDIVMRIRRALGYDVVTTEMEPNSHGWGGEHGRYRLNAQIILEEITENKKPAGQERASKSNNDNGLDNDYV